MIHSKGCDSWRSILVCVIHHVLTLWLCLFGGNDTWWSFKKDVIHSDSFFKFLSFHYIIYTTTMCLYDENDIWWSFQRMWFIMIHSLITCLSIMSFTLLLCICVIEIILDDPFKMMWFIVIHDIIIILICFDFNLY